MARRQSMSPAGNSTQRRRPGRVSGRRAALLLGVLTVTALLATPVAVANSSFDPVLVDATVITQTGSQVVPVTLGQLESYPTYASPPAPSSVPQFDASGVETSDPSMEPYIPSANEGTWPLSSVLDSVVSSAAIAGADVSSVDVINDGAPEPSLSSSDLQTPSTEWEDPEASPVLIVSGTYDDYYRPRTSDTDANGPDHVGQEPIGSATEDSPIDIEVYEQNSLKVTITAPSAQVSGGQTVNFQGASPDAPSGDTLNYAWTVDGAAAGADLPTLTYTFPDQGGSFQIGLTVTDPSAGKSGGAVPTTVDVMSDAPASTATTPAGTSTSPVGGTGSASSGPSQSTGTTSGATAGTSTTPGAVSAGSTQTHTTPVHSTSSPVTSPSGTQPGHAAGHGRTTSSAKTASGVSPSSATSGTSGGSATQGAPGSTAVRAPATATTHQPSAAANPGTVPRSPRPVPARSHLRQVSGVLVGDVVALSSGAAGASAPPAADGRAPGLAPLGHTSALTAYAAGAGVLLLLGLGIGQELRGRRARNRLTSPHSA